MSRLLQPVSPHGPCSQASGQREAPFWHQRRRLADFDRGATWKVVQHRILGAAPTVAATDWRQILHLYDQLLLLTPSPVVALYRAVAVAQVEGPNAAERDLLRRMRQALALA